MRLSDRLLCAMGLREFYKIIHNGTSKHQTPCYGKYNIYKYCPWNGCYLMIPLELNTWRTQKYAIDMIIALERDKFSLLRPFFDWNVNVKTSCVTGE